MENCIIWPGAKSGQSGYGVKVIKQKNYYVHRLALAEKLGRPIKKGYCACHTCDNPACVNPEHLWEGTYSQNMQDASKKGSWRNSKHRKLSEAQVRKIYSLRKKGLLQREIAKRFGVGQVHVSRILRGVRCRYIHDELKPVAI